MEKSTCAFTVRVSDRFGRRELEWKSGSSEEFAQIFGQEAGQALIRAVDEPTPLQILSDSSSRYQQLSPSQRAALAAHLVGGALPPSSPAPIAVPPPPLPPSPSPAAEPGLILDAQAFTVSAQATEAPKPQQKLKDSVSKELKEAKGDKWFLILMFCFLCLSLANGDTLFSLRRLLPAEAIKVVDTINPAIYVMKFLGKQPTP